MTPEQRREMLRAQARNWVRSETGMGSDADEAEYAAALRTGDWEKIADCERRAAERVARVDAAIERGELL